MGAWNEISNDEFINCAISENHRVRTMWSGNLSGDTKSRKCIIDSREHWRIVMENSFLPWYKNGKLPQDDFAENFILNEYCVKASKEGLPAFSELLENLQDVKILTVYHNGVNKRLIVDGIHHAVAIQSKINKHERVPEVELIECYGPQVDKDFLDFKHLLK
jgi:hypothetical protein